MTETDNSTAKKRVAILFGGASAEHDVSILSAMSIVENLDVNLFTATLIGLDRDNRPYRFETIQTSQSDQLFTTGQIMDYVSLTALLTREIDVAFPIIHGPGGEDGQLQGFLKVIGLPFVGADVTASAICMDKRLAKEVLKANGFKQAAFISLTKSAYNALTEDNSLAAFVEKALNYPIFVKPSNLGSSLGIHKVHRAEDLENALEDAFKYDKRVLLEQGIDARELECGVLGTIAPRAMAVGEIVASHEFYDYEAKYSDQAPSELIVPAKISEKVISTIRAESVRAYELLGCEGMARVDFLVDRNTEEVYLSELNTLPGFTKFSMYPTLCAQMGVSYRALITDLLEQAMGRTIC